MFTKAAGGQVGAIVGLGLLLNVGVATLGSMLANPLVITEAARNGLAWIPSIVPFLQVYAAAFFAIPTFRYIRNWFLNKQIEARNEARVRAAAKVAQPNGALVEKLAAARRQGEVVVIRPDDIVFTTRNDAGPQLNDMEQADWDRRLDKAADWRN